MYANYIYQKPGWPHFIWSDQQLIAKLAEVRHAQGRVIGKMVAVGFELKEQANLEVLTQDVVKTSEIEGENLDRQQVRSSVARHLGLEISGLVNSDRHVDGVVEMMLDATGKFDQRLTKKRLFGWHNALFPGGYGGIFKITTGAWRTDARGPMQVVSGTIGKEKVHFEAPEAKVVNQEMTAFLKWLNANQPIDLVLKAALAHLWFVTIHPFADGNGRIARAIADMLLARSDGQSTRFYSMSTQIRNDRQQYYHMLETTQKGNLDVTNWMMWFLDCLGKALEASESILSKVIFKHDFWQQHASVVNNPRQLKVLNKLLDGFEGKLTTTKWAKITKSSPDTALRDIRDLVEKGILYKLPEGGRSSGYDLVK